MTTLGTKRRGTSQQGDDDVDNKPVYAARFAIPSALAIASAVVMLAGYLVFGARIPGQALAVIGGAYALVLIWAAISLSCRGITIPVGMLGLRLLFASPGRRLLSCQVAVTGSWGSCPYGFKVGDVFHIDQRGALLAPLCQTAFDALEQAATMSPEEGNQSAGCRCPLGDRQLEFSLKFDTVSPA